MSRCIDRLTGTIIRDLRVFGSCMKSLVLVGSIGLCAGNGLAQSYPIKPIRFIVPYPAGGGVDTLARLIAPKLTERLGQQVVVDNRGGAGGNIGTELAARAAPDGRFSSALAVHQHIRAGKVRPLAVTTVKRSSVLPDLPTLASFYPGFECDNWYAVFVPAGTPKEIIGRLHAEVVKALNTQEMRDFITREGAEPVGSSPEELTAYFMREVDKYAKIIKAAQIRLE